MTNLIRNSPSGQLKEAGAGGGGIEPPAGQIDGTAADPLVVGITESGGTELDVGSIADGTYLRRSGAQVVGETPTSSQVSDASALPGATVSDSLNYLGGQNVAAATGAAPALDFATTRYYVLTLSANCSPTMTVPPAGVEAILEVVQGSGPFTLTLPANVDVQTVASGGGAPSLSTVAGTRNIFKFLSNGTRLRLVGVGEYA